MNSKTNSLNTPFERFSAARILGIVGFAAAMLPTQRIAASTVGFTLNCYRVAESNRVAQVLVERRSGASGRVSVRVEAYEMRSEDYPLNTLDCVVQGLPAKANDDFTPIQTVVTWEDGESGPKAVEIPIAWNSDTHEVLDGQLQLPEDVAYQKDYLGLRLIPLELGDTTLAKQKAILNIENSPGAHGLICTAIPYIIDRFAGIVPPRVTIGPDATEVSIAFERQASAAGAVSALYEVRAAPPGFIPSARPNIDFFPTTGSIAWADGESGIRTIVLPLPKYAVKPVGGGFQFEVVLTQTTGGSLFKSVLTTPAFPTFVPLTRYTVTRFGAETKRFVLLPPSGGPVAAPALEYECNSFNSISVESSADLKTWTSVPTGNLQMSPAVNASQSGVPNNIPWAPFSLPKCEPFGTVPNHVETFYIRESAAPAGATRFYRLRLSKI